MPDEDAEVTWKSELIKGVAWFLSRLLLAAALVALAYLVKIPVDNVIVRDFSTDIRRLRADDQRAQIEVLHNLKDLADTAVRAVETASTSLLTLGRPSAVSDYSTILTEAQSRIETLRGGYVDRDASVDGDFERVTFEVYQATADLTARLRVVNSSGILTPSARSEIEVGLRLVSHLQRKQSGFYVVALTAIGAGAE